MAKQHAASIPATHDKLTELLRKAKGICDLALSARGLDSDAYRASAWAVSDLIDEAQDKLKRCGA